MGKKIYVGNMNFKTSEAALKDAFEEFGEVASVKLVIDHLTGRPKGFGFIEMVNDDDAMNAINAMNGKELDGRQLKVNEAHDKPRKPRFSRDDDR